MRYSCIILLVFIGVEASAALYPINPRPLRKLVLESEIVLTGYVKDIIKTTKKKDSFASVAAVITVYDVLQGVVVEKEIVVPYLAGLICPAPPHYAKGTHVVVFLNREKGEYRTHALSYGVKTLEPAGVEVYKSRILELQTILKIKDKDEQFLQTTDWLVRCAENSVTRYEGVYELSPQSDFMSFYDREELGSYQYLLTTEQKNRLKTALILETAADYHDFGLIDLVYGGNEQEIFSFMLDRLEQLDLNAMWFADGYMKRLCLSRESGKLKDLIEEFDSKQYDYEIDVKVRDERLKQIVKEFVTEIRTL